MPYAVADNNATVFPGGGIAPGAYFTDGDNLFRVLELCPCADADHLVTCEDCLTLEMLVCPLSHIQRGEIALVREGHA